MSFHYDPDKSLPPLDLIAMLDENPKAFSMNWWQRIRYWWRSR